jgi:hypothetical protein
MNLKMKFWGRPAMEIPTFKLIRPHLVFYSIGSGKKYSIIFMLKTTILVYFGIYIPHTQTKRIRPNPQMMPKVTTKW